MSKKVKKLFQRIKYRKQLRIGYALLSTQKNRDFVICGENAFVMNGRDPLVKVNLSSRIVEQYQNKAYHLSYKVSVENALHWNIGSHQDQAP